MILITRNSIIPKRLPHLKLLALSEGKGEIGKLKTHSVVALWVLNEDGAICQNRVKGVSITFSRVGKGVSIEKSDTKGNEDSSSSHKLTSSLEESGRRSISSDR